MKGENIEIGAFSISLVVQDIVASKAFYEKFGFEVIDEDTSQLWQIMKNKKRMIGGFSGDV